MKRRASYAVTGAVGAAVLSIALMLVFAVSFLCLGFIGAFLDGWLVHPRL